MAGPKPKPPEQHFAKLNFTLPQPLFEALQDFCMSMGGRPKARVIQDALTEYLERHKDDRPIWVKNTD